MKRKTNSVVGSAGKPGARRSAIIGLTLLGLVLLAAVSWGHDSNTMAGEQTSTLAKTAPNFALTNLSGKTVRLSDFKGKIVLLDFWATWCPPCRAEIPDFIQLQKKYADKGFTVVGVALNEGGAAVVKPFAKKIGITYPVVIGNPQVANTYGGIAAIPTAFLIGRDGRILNTFVGARPKSAWEQTIKSALQQAGKGQN